MYGLTPGCNCLHQDLTALLRFSSGRPDAFEGAACHRTSKLRGACAGAFAGISLLALLLVVQGIRGSDDDTLAEEEVLTLPSNASLDSCTLTYPDGVSELMREAYVRTFFNVTCLATNSTGDPCDLHLAEEYTHHMFSALRFDRLVMEFLAFVAIFSLAQIGGIPRPTDWNGMFFWLAWMATMLAQYVVILCALILQVFSFLAVRARLSQCLIRVDGTALLDFYAMCTFAVQPELLIKATMLFVYSFLLSLGMLVFDGSRQWPWRIKKCSFFHAALPVVFLMRLRQRAESRKDASNSALASVSSALDSYLDWTISAIGAGVGNFLRWGANSPPEIAPRPQLLPAPSRGESSSPAQMQMSGGDGTRATSATTSAVKPGGDSASGMFERAVQTTVQKVSSRFPLAVQCFEKPPISKAEFVEDANGPIMPSLKRFKVHAPFALCHYHLARTIVLGAIFSIWAALGSPAATPGVMSAWVLALLLVVLPRSILDVVDQNGCRPLHILSLILFCSTLSASAILPLSALFMLVVQLAYFLVRRVLAHVSLNDDGNARVWIDLPNQLAGRCKFADNLAGPTHTCLSWLHSTSKFSHVDGVLGRSQGEGLTFTSTSYATLAGGLSCFWVLLALAPLASHGAWARSRSLSLSQGVAVFANDTALALGDVDGLTGEWSWVWGSLMVWMWLGAAIALCCCSCGACFGHLCLESWDASFKAAKEYAKSKTRRQFINFNLGIIGSCADGINTCWALNAQGWYVRTAGACALFALIICIFTAYQTDEAKELIATTYANSLAALSGLQLDLGGILPSLDELVEVLSDPIGALSSVVQRIANLSSYAEFDPAYFAEGVQALEAINLVLSFIKLLATYGRKIFALYDSARSIRKTYAGDEAASEGDDGTVQVYETITDLDAIGILNLLNKDTIKEKPHHGAYVSFAQLAKRKELDFVECELVDGDLRGLVALATHPNMAFRKLHLQGNMSVTPQAWKKMRQKVKMKCPLVTVYDDHDDHGVYVRV